MCRDYAEIAKTKDRRQDFPRWGKDKPAVML